jgi:hypothetical protein
MKQEDTEENRRSYFRIDDQLQLSFEPITPGELGARELAVMQGSVGFMVTSELHALRQESAPLLRQIGGHSPDIASYLEAMERRIELLARFLAVQTSDLIRQPVRDVSLSAGGISFYDAQPLAPTSHVELRLLLGSSHLCLTAIAEVMSCDGPAPDTGPEGQYLLRMEFRRIREQDRNLITRHILGRQGEQLRQRRGL